MSFEEELALATRAARDAGALLRDAFSQEKRVLSEKGRDIKLQADRDAEAIILEVLGTGKCAVLAEESGEHGAVDSGDNCWIVDPLDGTMNFSRGLPACCVSIALARGEDPLLGVVYDFLQDDLYAGIPGEGAWCNGEPMHVSSIRDASHGILSSGFPVYFDFETGLRDLAESVRRFKKIRMIGSAALSLAYVASGRFEAYTENNIMYWDIAAGMALVRAAGGWVETEPTQKTKWSRRVRAACAQEMFNV